MDQRSNTIRAIETRYAGCHFRSRLEARWAVFFDAAGIAWEYEPEGFVLPDETHYLPDFKLPKLRVWVEVKPEINARDTKWRPFHELINGPDHWMWASNDEICESAIGIVPTPTANLIGWPWRTIMIGQVPDPRAIDYGIAIGPGSPHCGWEFRLCDMCGEIDLIHVIGSLARCGHFNAGRNPETRDRRITDAYEAARSARFEWGQSGAT